MISTTGLVGVAAGVPYVAHRPAGALQRAPLVVVLHLMDPPRSEVAMAAALPLAGVPAWRAYLGPARRPGTPRSSCGLAARTPS